VSTKIDAIVSMLDEDVRQHLELSVDLGETVLTAEEADQTPEEDATPPPASPLASSDAEAEPAEAGHGETEGRHDTEAEGHQDTEGRHDTETEGHQDTEGRHDTEGHHDTEAERGETEGRHDAAASKPEKTKLKVLNGKGWIL
jgi:hypothetical protein